MGAVIYRPTDRIEVKFENFSVWLSPLTVEQKGALQALYQSIAGEDKSNAGKVATETLRYTVKELKGVFLSDDTEYQLEFGPDGRLTEACAEELKYLDSSDKVIMVGGRVGLGTFRYDDIADFGTKFQVLLDKERSKKKKETS